MKKLLKLAIDWLAYIATLLEEVVKEKNALTEDTKAGRPKNPPGDG